MIAALALVLQFPVYRRCHSHLPTLLPSSSWSKIQNFVGNSTLSEVVQEIQLFPVSVAISPFPVVGRRRNNLPTLFELSMVANQRFAVGISILSVIVSVI